MDLTRKGNRKNQTATRWLTIANEGDGLAVVKGSANINQKQVVSLPASNGDFPRGTFSPSIGKAPICNTKGSPKQGVRTRSMAYAFDIYPGNNLFSFDTDDPTQREFTDGDGNIFVPIYHDGFVVCWIGVPEVGGRLPIRVYPSPASDVVTVKCEYDIRSIEIISYLGQTVYSKKYDGEKEARIQVSGMPSGIYFVMVNTDKGVGISKMVVIL